ncbi:MAG: biosynthetic-type acetolactate synthase large subunit [Alistipes sp.]|nr:biosynthetic-type acetolactate synthase large subunit [Alistipes sp.]
MPNKQKIKGAEALLLSLIAEGTDTIFGYPGGQVIPIYDHLYSHTDQLHHILTRHEQGAVHAAQGYARATGKVGVCLATSGPGATNLVTGIADAMLDSTPIICITGQVPSSLLGTDAFQEADTISMTMPISKWNFQVTKASEIPGAIAKAYYIAQTGRPGPVVIDIAKNAQVEEFDFSYKPCIYLRSYTPKPILDETQIVQAVQMINASQKPLLLIGQGVKLSGAETQLIEFAEAAGVPMAATLMGISAVPNEHPLFIGNLGMHGNIAANQMTQQSDLILAVGMRFSDRVTGDVKNYAPQAKIIQIDIDRAELGKNIAVDLAIHADAAEALKALKKGIQYHDRAAWLHTADACNQQELRDVIQPSTDPNGTYISMYDVVSTLAEVEKSDAVIVTDVGQNQMFSARYSRFKHTRSFITSGGLGTMGFGLPAAMGAKLGVPDKEVVAILGDGGFQMTMQELGTIMQNQIGLKMIVVNNTYLGMVRQWQQLFFHKRYSFTELENPDFTTIAGAYGIANRRVERLADLRSGIEELAAAPGAFFLEVDVPPEENVFPMVPAGASLSNTICKE